MHIFIQFELAQDSGSNLVVELCVFYRVQNVRTSLSTFLILHLITLSLACLMLVGILEICFFLQLQGPFDNNANLRIYVFRPLSCQVANCKFWASSSPPPESISTGCLVNCARSSQIPPRRLACLSSQLVWADRALGPGADLLTSPGPWASLISHLTGTSLTAFPVGITGPHRPTGGSC